MSSNAKIPGPQYAAIAGLFVRVHNGDLTAENVLQIMGGTLGCQDEVDYFDLDIWRKNEARIFACADKLGITLNPTRVTRALDAIKFITPTTPLCTDPKCRQFTITNERGAWETVQAGKSCPVKGCNEKVRKTEVETKRRNWITGAEVAITQEFDRDHGSEPVPLTQAGIIAFIESEKDEDDDADGKVHKFYAEVIKGEGLKDVPEPYIRILNVLACHSEFASKFPAGPKQIIRALVTPKAFGIGRNDMKTLGELAKERWWGKGGTAAESTKTVGIRMPRGHVLNRAPFYIWLRKRPMDDAVQIRDLFNDVDVRERATAKEIMSEVMNRHAMGDAIDFFRTISSQLPHLFTREAMMEICIPLQRAEQISGTSSSRALFNFSEKGVMDWDQIAKVLADKYRLPDVYETPPYESRPRFSPSAVVNRLTERYSYEQIAQMINEACGFETER